MIWLELHPIVQEMHPDTIYNETNFYIWRVNVDTYSDGVYPQSPVRVCSVDFSDGTEYCTAWEYVQSSAGYNTVSFDNSDLYNGGAGPVYLGSQYQWSYLYVVMKIKRSSSLSDRLYGVRAYWDTDGV